MTRLIAAILMAASATDAGSAKFDFESDTPGEPPKGFQFGRTGEGDRKSVV